MSAGNSDVRPRVSHDVAQLAPKFAAAVEATIAACRAVGIDAVVFEAVRSPELAQLYYTRGRPPTPEYPKPVTNAPNNQYTWHGYGLAVDIISASKEWDAGDEWFRHMALIAKAHGCKWGGDWKQKDLPHIQFGKCKASPSPQARALLASGGMQAVWRAVGAIDG